MRNWPSENFVPKNEKPNKIPERIANILSQVENILQNPEAQNVAKADFDQKFEEIVKDPEMLNNLLEQIKITMKSKLENIYNDFKSGKIDDATRLDESGKTIKHYTQLQLNALNQSIN